MKSLPLSLLVAGALFFTGDRGSVSGGCNCQQGVAAPRGMSGGVLMHGGPMMYSGAATSGHLSGAPNLHLSYGSAGFAVPPPPGTIGQTYSRPSHPIPVDEHPRTAMLAIRDNGVESNLSVQNMGGFRMKNQIWLFESNQPLAPGVSSIVRVEARKEEADVQAYKVKFVRLIPGRIVYLDF